MIEPAGTKASTGMRSTLTDWRHGSKPGLVEELAETATSHEAAPTSSPEAVVFGACNTYSLEGCRRRRMNQVADQTRHIPPLDQSIARVELPLITDGRGNLTFVEGQRHVPFDIARVYYLHDVPSGIMRAGHAHRTTQQLMIGCAGAFSVHFSNGIEQQL